MAITGNETSEIGALLAGPACLSTQRDRSTRFIYAGQPELEDYQQLA